MIINKASAALSNFKLFCSENLLKFPLTRIPTNVGKAINITFSLRILKDSDQILLMKKMQHKS